MREIIETLSIIKADSANRWNEETNANIGKAIAVLEALEEYEIFDERLTVSDAAWAYYATSGDTGHYDLLKVGIDNYDKPFIVVIGSDLQREKYEGFKTVHYSKLADHAGIGYPLAWDSKALMRMMSSFSMIQNAFNKIKGILQP